MSIEAILGGADENQTSFLKYRSYSSNETITEILSADFQKSEVRLLSLTLRIKSAGGIL